MPPRAVPSDGGGGGGRGRGGGRSRGRGRGRGYGGSEYGGGSERGGGPGGSDYGSGRGHGNRGAGRGRWRGDLGGPRGGVDRGASRGRRNRSRGRGVIAEAGPTHVQAVSGIVDAPAVVGASAVVEAGGAVIEAGDDMIVEAGGHALLTLPTLSSGRTGPLPAGPTEATGVKRRGFGNAGRTIKLRSNHVEVKLDQVALFHYDGVYLSYSWER